MKHDLHDYLKLGMDNPKKVAAVWFAILMVMSSLGYNVFNFLDYKPPQAPEKPVQTPEQIIDQLALPPKEMPETVTVTHAPHTHPELEELSRKVGEHISGDDDLH